ncbi:hypothetical protein IWQ62_005401, partial [Dispira parvispora]
GSLERGIDLPNVSAVLLADFVENMGDYIHRAGRTGRAGQPGEDAHFEKKSLEPFLDSEVVKDSNPRE